MTPRSAHTRLLLELGSPLNSSEEAISDEAECYVITRFKDEPNHGYQTITNYLRDLEFPPNSSAQQHKDIRRRAFPFTLIGDTIQDRSNKILRSAVTRKETKRIMSERHEGVCGLRFATNSTAHKILTFRYFQPSLFKDCVKYCQSCSTCQAYRKKTFTQTELHPIFPTGALGKWGLDFVRALPKIARQNEYLIMATDYLTKWSEAVCMFDKFHLTFNFKSKVSRDVFKNKNECQSISTFFF